MPTIMPGILSTIRPTEHALGSSDSPAANIIFSRSPLYTDYRDVQIRNAYQRPLEVIGDDGSRQINDQSYMYGIADRDYQQSPDLSTVAVGGGGLPGNFFGPNIAVVSHNNADTPLAGMEATNRVRSLSNGAFNGNGMVSPSQTVRGITPRRLGVGLPNGVGSGNTFLVRV